MAKRERTCPIYSYLGHYMSQLADPTVLLPLEFPAPGNHDRSHSWRYPLFQKINPPVHIQTYSNYYSARRPRLCRALFMQNAHYSPVERSIN